MSVRERTERAPQAAAPTRKGLIKGAEKELPPMQQFLNKITWSKRRRSLFFILTVVAYLIDIGLCLQYAVQLPNYPFEIPVVRAVFLGWNFLYNTQGPGTLSAPDWKAQKLWRSWLFPVHLFYSACILLFRMFAIKIHERDLGTWIRKDWQLLFLKVGRVCLLCPLIIIYFLEVAPLQNPTIVNTVFYEECQLLPAYNLHLLQFQTINSTKLGSSPNCSALSVLPEVETFYRGYVPDGRSGPEAGMVMVTMVPVGDAEACQAAPSLVTPPYETFFTQTKQACLPSLYQFSNWLTKSTTCEALEYNQFYASVALSNPSRAQQWFCNVTGYPNATHLTVSYDTVFGRFPLNNKCFLSSDAPFLFHLTSACDMLPEITGGTVSSPVSALNSTELVSLAGYNYSDFGSCTDMTVSCLQDSENPFLFYRSVSLTNCVNVTHGSLTALTDQASWDQWLSNWKSSYYYAVGGVVVEVGWDLVEYVAYIVL